MDKLAFRWLRKIKATQQEKGGRVIVEDQNMSRCFAPHGCQLRHDRECSCLFSRLCVRYSGDSINHHLFPWFPRENDALSLITIHPPSGGTVFRGYGDAMRASAWTRAATSRAASITLTFMLLSPAFEDRRFRKLSGALLNRERKAVEFNFYLVRGGARR